MDILVVGDCHGEKPDLDEEKVDKADIILATGDFCGGGDELRSKMFESMDEEWEWYEEMGEGKAREAVLESIKEGREVLEHLNSFGKPVFVVPGNWDWSGEIYSGWEFLQDNKFQEMIEGLENVQNINFDSKDVNGFTVIGYGPCSGPEIPQYEDDEPDTEQEREEVHEEYERVSRELKELFEAAENPVIFLSHNVPLDTSLDKIDNPDSPVHGRHYGSLIVRELIDTFEPEVSAGGHIHEGYGREQVEGVPCVNAGIESSVFLDLSSDDIEVEFDPEVPEK